MSYEPPLIDSPLEFTDTGYSTPVFRDIGVIQDLGMAIRAMEFKRDYLKSCKTYVVGFNQYNVQILKQDCIYGGIRDLAASIDIGFLLSDVSFYIKPTLSNNLDLGTLVKGASSGISDVLISTKGYSLENPLDLPAYIKQGFSSSTDFDSYVKTFLPSFTEVSSIIKGWLREESKELPEAIKAFNSLQKTLPAYLKPNFSDIVDLTLDIFKILHPDLSDLSFSVGGWQETNLLEYIHAISYVNLSTTIKATYLYDLAAVMTAVSPENLAFSLYGWDTIDVNFNIAYAKSPYDVPITINPVPSVNLLVTLKSFLSIETLKNLPIQIQSYYRTNLNAFINSVPVTDLAATLIPKGQSLNLGAVIYPKIVYVRTLISLSYLECLDLAASVNPSCFSSSYRDLLSQLYSMHSTNLSMSVFGTDGSNIIDLAAVINSYDYYEENSITLRAFKEPIKYTSVTLKYTEFKTYTEIDTLELNLAVLKSDVLYYTKDPELSATDSAIRYVEEAEVLSTTDVDEYLVDLSRSDVVCVIGDHPEVILNIDQKNVIFDGNTGSSIPLYASMYGEHTDTIYLTLSKTHRLSGIRLYLYSPPVTDSLFYDDLLVYVRKYQSDEWILVATEPLGELLTNTLDKTLNFDTIEARYVKFVYTVGVPTSTQISISLIQLLSDVVVTTSGDLFKEHYDFEYFLDDDDITPWERERVTTIITEPLVPRNNPLVLYNSDYSSLGTVVTYKPNEWLGGSHLDYFEFYIYIVGGADQPAFRLYTTEDTTLFGISFDDDGALKYYVDNIWTTVSSGTISGNNNWYRVRTDFDWDLESFMLTYEDTSANVVETFEDLPFMSLDEDDSTSPSTSIGTSFGSSGNTANLFDNNNGTIWTSSVGPGVYFGYTFVDTKVLKQLRFFSYENTNKLPYNFEIRASDAAVITDPYSGTVLFTVNEPFDAGYWSINEWKVFNLDNPNNIRYRSVWIVCYDSTDLHLREVEVFSKRSSSEYNISSIEVTKHNTNFDDEFWRGWNGLVSEFYLDDFHAQELTYRRVIDNYNITNLSATINVNYMQVDLPVFARAYSPLSHEASAIKKKFITLKLNYTNVEEWRRHVELTFSNYVSSYYYFSGNQQVYREFVDDQWVVQVKGYTLTDLPEGVDRSKVNRKYIFNLKHYSSIDEAIKDMVDRVTALKENDLGCFIEAEPKKEANLSVHIASSVKRTYKSNRVLPVSINPYLAIFDNEDTPVYDNDDNLLLIV